MNTYYCNICDNEVWYDNKESCFYCQCCDKYLVDDEVEILQVDFNKIGDING